MRTYKAGLILLGFFVMLLAAAPALASPQADQTVAHVVMFWSEGCPHCEKVLTEVLPEIQDQYGDRLEIMLIEVSDVDEVDRLFKIADSLGYDKDNVFVPFLIIGKHVLIGSTQIPEHLPKLIDDYLGTGGVDYPALPELTQMLPQGTTFISYQSGQLSGQLEPEETSVTLSSGLAIAAVILVAMLIALIYVFVVFLRAFQGRPLGSGRGWQEVAIPVLALLGLGVAAYMTYVEVTTADAVCGPIGDCNTVQNSTYAKVFGVLPVGILGAAGYVAILLAWAIRRYGSGGFSDLAPLALFGMSLFGTLYSVYLTYIELFVIKAVCMWCLSSAVIITLLMLFSLSPAAAWVAEE